MPIILLWNETVGGSLAQFQRWFDNIGRSCFLLERWLEKRLREAEDIERLTSRFPVFRFYNEAVAAEIVGIQLGELLDAPVTGLGGHIERALGQWNVVRRLRAGIRSNRLLPELFRVLEEITGGVLASLNRFARPTATMFDPRSRTASDLFGIAALAFRAIGSSRDQIVQAATQVRDAFLTPSAATAGSSPGRGATPPAAPSEPTLPLEYRLDEFLRYVGGALLVLPALGGLVGTIGSDVLLQLRYTLLGMLEGAEERAHAFRQQILDVFLTDLPAYAEEALVFVYTARDVGIGYLQFYARVGTEYLRGVVSGVTAFATQFQTFWTGVIDVIHRVIAYGNGVIGVNIGPILHNGLVTVEDAIETIDTHLYAIGEEPEFYHAPGEFPVTIGEMVLNEGAGARANQELGNAIRLLRAAWNGADPIAAALNAGIVHRLKGTHIPLTIASLQQLVNALALPRAGRPTQPTLSFDASTVPDLNARIIQPLREGATAAINDAVIGVAHAVEGVADVVVRTLDSTAAAFETAASRAAHFGAMRLLRRLTRNTDTLLASLFLGEERAAPPASFEQVGGTYAQWLIQGGFDTIGGVLAGFVGMVLDEWVVHLESGEDTPAAVTPASPRKLLERARLGRVHTPEIRIVARGEELGRGLASRIAGRFQQAVQDAYNIGQTRLEGVIEAAP